MIELLVVIAIIGILAALLLPVLSAAKARGHQAACSANLRQFALGWQMYASDNDSKLIVNLPAVFSTNFPATLGTNNAGTWALGNMAVPAEATNRALVRQGILYPYTGDTGLYHCPADPSQFGGQARVRSYSMNGWVGGRYMSTLPAEAGYHTYVNESAIAIKGASDLWVLADEHEGTIDDSFFVVTMSDSQPFVSFPATRHRRGYNLNFADGHVEHYALRDPNTQWPAAAPTSAVNSDWLKLKQVTTMP